MASLHEFLAVFLFSSSIFIALSHGRHLETLTTIHADVPPCLQKILPCEPFIKAPTNPPPSCCVPLKQMLVGDVACLCSIFNNQDLLKAMNVTQSEALKLPQACGAAVDPSKCKNAASSPIGLPPPAPAATTNGTTPSKHSSSSRVNPAYGMNYGFAGLAWFFMALLF